MTAVCYLAKWTQLDTRQPSLLVAMTTWTAECEHHQGTVAVRREKQPEPWVCPNCGKVVEWKRWEGWPPGTKMI